MLLLCEACAGERVSTRAWRRGPVVRDLPEVGQVQWGGALDLASITGDNTTAGHAETGFASVTSFVVNATTSTKIMIQTFAKSADQAVLNGAGFFTAKRIAA